MDVQVTEVEGDVGHHRVSNDGDAERNDGGDMNNAENSSATGDEVAIIEPYLGMEFSSEDAAKSFYDEYARRIGFSSKVQHNRSKPDGTTVFREFVCGREGLKRRHADSCDAMLRIELKAPDKWVVTKFVKDHSHSIVSPSKVHYLRPRRHFAGAAKTMADVYEGVGIVPSGIMYVSLDGNRAPTETSNRETRSSSPLESNRHAKNTGPSSASPSESNDAVRNMGPLNITPLDSIPQGTNTRASNTLLESNHGAKNTGPLNSPPLESNHHVKNNGPPHTPPSDSNRIVKNSGPSNTPLSESNRFVKNSGPLNTPPVDSNRPLKNAGPLTYVIRPSYRKRTLGRDAQNMLDYFKKMQAENPGFFYAIQLDDDNRMANVFWADARSRTAYNHFGDSVTLDTMYKVYQYKVPFAPFTGINHHGQTILFGCALLLDDSEASFLWLFKTFLTAMSDRQPVSITTDQDRTIKAAVAQVFPQARHCISRWHVLREGQEKLAHVCQAHPNFQIDLYSCINLTETIEEFESSWSSILDKYDLRGHDWLQSIYNSRAQWVPVYFRDSFFAAISPNHGYEGSFFDGYVNQQTTIPMFFRQYERALENWFEREIEADFDTVCTTPVLRTPSPMEKQAASFYTRKIFSKFQEELVETFVYTANRIEGDGAINTFRVAKYEDDSKAYIVTLNYPEMRANCSCQMFEYSGILCRHVLTVFTVTNVLTLPSHYILRRWTRNSKTWGGADENTGELPGQESVTMRYNNLCREAIKYAEDGAVAAETYHAAMGALREGGKKVAVVKKNVAKVAPPNSQVGGTGPDDRKISTSASDSTPLLWPRQDEMTKRFNLNDGGVLTQPVSDLNLPRMAPVSLHRDDGPSDNVVGLPCLKSMTWVMEKKNSAPGNKVAVINLKLQDYSKNPSAELEVKFHLSRVTLEPMLKSMAYISEQLSTPANKVAVINLKLQDTETISGESEVKFQVSKDTLGAMLRSMAYIKEQLSNAAEPHSDPPPKKQRK